MFVNDNSTIYITKLNLHDCSVHLAFEISNLKHIQTYSIASTASTYVWVLPAR